MIYSKKTFNFIYLVFVIVFSGYATGFYRSVQGLLFLFAYTLIVIGANKVKFSKSFSKIVIVFVVYNIILMYLYGEMFEIYLLRHILYFYVGYTLIFIFKKQFFEKYISIIVFFSIISLFFFIWQTISLSSMTKVFTLFDISGYDEGNSKNIFFYTLHRGNIYGEMNRNCGFTWEPGPFSIFIVVALYFNYLIKGLKLDYRVIILVITLLTTQSTTGLGILLAISFYIFIYNNQNIFRKTAILLFIIPIFLFSFFRLDFMYNKIDRLYRSGSSKNIAANSRKDDNASFGRFGALEIGLIDFKNNWLLGYGGSSRRTYLRQTGIKANMVSGIAVSMGMYGIIGMMYFLIIIYRGSRSISLLFKSNQKLVYILIFLLAMFGFHAQTFMILWAPIMLFTFKNNKQIFNRANNKLLV